MVFIAKFIDSMPAHVLASIYGNGKMTKYQLLLILTGGKQHRPGTKSVQSQEIKMRMLFLTNVEL